MRSMAETLSWRLAAVSTTEMGAPRPSTRRLIFAPDLPLSVGFLPVFSPPKGAAECLESMACHFQGSHPAPLRSIGPSSSHQLVEDSHLPPPLEAFMDHAGGHSKPITMNGLPLTSRPKHVPDGVDDGPIRGPGPAAFRTHLPVVFGQAFLELPPQRARKVEVVHPPRYGSLFHKAHLL